MNAKRSAFWAVLYTFIDVVVILWNFYNLWGFHPWLWLMVAHSPQVVLLGLHVWNFHKKIAETDAFSVTIHCFVVLVFLLSAGALPPSWGDFEPLTQLFGMLSYNLVSELFGFQLEKILNRLFLRRFD